MMPMNNFGQMMQRIQQIQQSYPTPQDFMKNVFPNVPAQYTSDPNQALQYMLNNNMIGQNQINFLNNLIHSFR